MENMNEDTKSVQEKTRFPNNYESNENVKNGTYKPIKIIVEKIKRKKYIKVAIVAFLSIVLFDKCLLTNEPDRIYEIREEKLVEAYIYQQNPTPKRSSYLRPPPEIMDDPELLYHWEHYFPHSFNLDDGLKIWFNYDFYGSYFNTDYQKMHGRLYMDGLYKYIYIQEINVIFNNRTKKRLMESTKFDIQGRIQELVDKNGNQIIIDGKKYHYLSNIELKKLNHHFISGFIGKEMEIELESIYNFDNELLRNEKHKYKVICGGKKFDITRPFIWMFPP